MDEKRSHSNRFLEKLSDYYLPTLLIIGLILILNISKSNPNAGTSTVIPHEEILELVVGYAVFFCEMTAVFIIASAAIHALIGYLRGMLDKVYINQIKSSESLRLRLGHKLSLGLEFAVAADILRLAVSPTFVDIILLFAIILLRILLNYFLEHDIQIIRDYNLVPALNELSMPEQTDEKKG
ncbi:MAG: DUF1622 domain-containing protein [Anaerolineaceae bacterium]|nr:DUF1622 domain-containing protein [Anaerolineaceae bacterium]